MILDCKLKQFNISQRNIFKGLGLTDLLFRLGALSSVSRLTRSLGEPALSRAAGRASCSRETAQSCSRPPRAGSLSLSLWISLSLSLSLWISLSLSLSLFFCGSHSLSFSVTCSRALPSCCRAASRPPPSGPAGLAVQGASPWAPPPGLSRAPPLECPSWPRSWLSGCVGLLPRWRPRRGAGSLPPGAARPSGSWPSLGLTSSSLCINVICVLGCCCLPFM